MQTMCVARHTDQSKPPKYRRSADTLAQDRLWLPTTNPPTDACEAGSQATMHVKQAHKQYRQTLSSVVEAEDKRPIRVV
jgi:hypothetical protein